MEITPKKTAWQIGALLVLTAIIIVIVRQQKTIPFQHNTGFIFGTIYNITYQSDNDLQTEIEGELKKVDESLSTFNKTSTISKINQGKDVKVDDMFAEVFTLGENIAKETDGAFDMTVAPMVNTWGFGFKTGKEPSKAVVDSLRNIVGYQKIKMEKKHIIKQNPNTMLDCSAIAKGFGSDVVAKFLRQKGIKNFMIEIGGEIVTYGLNEKRVPWKIGVTKPVDDSLNNQQEIQTILNVTNKAMATSGNYRKYYYKNGKKYAHTIDPKTGYPVQHNILSSTVFADNCATADAYATAFMVTGLDGAKKILAKHPELMAYFIYADQNGKNAVWYSPKLRKKIVN
ncbi:MULTISPECIES: FAD:protein FMN transferase [Segatella]|uniref:FAD:protein FMN transferase n=2 Tax=Segatella TaxID=2974251 RepID=D8DTC1_9BACT|nr:thiamine biosynthesis lipoprotein ApbE [Segatella baroniae B14]GJG27527.1 FAD:protein FMN transferase [Segatella bryantii]SEP66530.1 thiamine biosynthesis lipoprotein [Segatella baroniae B14]